MSHKKAMLLQRNRAMPQLFFSIKIKFANSIQYKFKEEDGCYF